MFKAGLSKILKIYDDLLVSKEEGGFGLSNDDIYLEVSRVCKEVNVCRTIEILKDYFFLVVSDEDDCNKIAKGLKRIYKDSKSIPEMRVLLDLKNILDSIVCSTEHSVVHGGDESNIDYNKSLSPIVFAYFINYYVASYIKPNVKILNKKYNDNVFDDCEGIVRSYVKSSVSDVKKSFTNLLGDKPYNGIGEYSLKIADVIKFTCQLNLVIFYKLIDSTLDSEMADYYLKNVSLGKYLYSYIVSELEDKETYCCLFNKFTSLLRKRKFLIPYNGVEISCIGIDVTIFERQFEGNNYLIVFPNDKKKTLCPMAINVNTGGVLGSSVFLYDILNILFYFYELDTKCDGLMSPNDPKLYNSFNFYNISSELITVKGTASQFKRFEVKVPYYWKYRGSSKNNHNGLNEESSLGSNFYGEETIQISAFTRKLPKGYTASEEAKGLAKKYCLDLEEGETVVSPFSKNIKVKIK